MENFNKNNRAIDCDNCTSVPTKLNAWVSDDLLSSLNVSHINDISDNDIRQLAGNQPLDCAIEGNCLKCDG